MGVARSIMRDIDRDFRPNSEEAMYEIIQLDDMITSSSKIPKNTRKKIISLFSEVDPVSKHWVLHCHALGIPGVVVNDQHELVREEDGSYIVNYMFCDDPIHIFLVSKLNEYKTSILNKLNQPVLRETRTSVYYDK